MSGDVMNGERAHRLDLTFEYADATIAGLIEAAISREVGEIEGDRTAATVARSGAVLTVSVAAEDLVALRAGLNTWCSLVDVAERVATGRP